MKKYLVALALLLGLIEPAFTQWQVPQFAIPVGRGAGFTGFNSVGPCTASQLIIWTGGVAANPACSGTLPTPFSAGTSLYPTVVSPGSWRYDATSDFIANTLGAKNVLGGTAAIDTNVTWLNAFVPGTDAPGQVTIYGINPSGVWGAMFAVRSSDNVSGTPQNIIGANAIAVHDKTTVGHQVWAMYNATYITATAAAGHIISQENSIFNNGSKVVEDPYNVNPVGGSVAYRADCANDGTHGANDCSAGIDIVNNGNKFTAGIVIGDNSLDTTVTANPPAVALPSAYALTWYNAAAAVSGKIYMDSGQKGWITPTAGTNVAGTNTNDNASAGLVGELVSSTVVAGSALALTNGAAASLTSISLTAGDWDVSFDDYFIPAATTSVTLVICSISTVTNTADINPGNFQQLAHAAQVPNATFGCKAGPRRMSLASTTTVFAVTQANFTVSTIASYGSIRARRVR
jgi:hypothetical protein